MSDIPEHRQSRWAESEIDTLVGMPMVSPATSTPPAPVKRRIMEQEPRVEKLPSREDVEQVEDQILRMAFGKATKSIRRRTYALIFFAGMIAGFIALGVTLVVLLTKAGAQ